MPEKTGLREVRNVFQKEKFCLIFARGVELIFVAD